MLNRRPIFVKNIKMWAFIAEPLVRDTLYVGISNPETDDYLITKITVCKTADNGVPPSNPPVYGDDIWDDFNDRILQFFLKQGSSDPYLITSTMVDRQRRGESVTENTRILKNEDKTHLFMFPAGYTLWYMMRSEVGAGTVNCYVTIEGVNTKL